VSGCPLHYMCETREEREDNLDIDWLLKDKGFQFDQIIFIID